MRYTEFEKKIATDFIDCKIPECIKQNKFEFAYDTMECYEALFDLAHCILEDLEFSSNFYLSINNNEFIELLKKMKANNENKCFCQNALNLFTIVNKNSGKE